MALFITFEGLDGSGKSTHLERIAHALAERGVAHTTTREPGGTELGSAIRKVFLHRRFRQVDGTVELLLVFASPSFPSIASSRSSRCSSFSTASPSRCRKTSARSSAARSTFSG